MKIFPRFHRTPVQWYVLIQSMRCTVQKDRCNVSETVRRRDKGQTMNSGEIKNMHFLPEAVSPSPVITGRRVCTCFEAGNPCS
jgi:hypothetical protein